MKLVKKGVIPFRKVGAHRLVLLQDVLDYKERIDQQRNQTLDELSQRSQDEGMGYWPRMGKFSVVNNIQSLSPT